MSKLHLVYELICVGKLRFSEWECVAEKHSLRGSMMHGCFLFSSCEWALCSLCSAAVALNASLRYPEPRPGLCLRGCRHCRSR